MSVSLAVGKVKSKADLLRKELDYRKLLRLQSRLNADAEKVSQLPVQQPLPLDIPTETNINLNMMISQVRKRLLSILNEKEANTFLYRYVRAKDDLAQFYKYMDEFIPIVRYDPDRPLNANYLFNIYTRWLQRKKIVMEGSGYGPGYYSLDPTIQTEMDRIGQGIKGVILNSGLSPTETLRYVQQTEDAMRAFDYMTIKKIAGGRL